MELYEIVVLVLASARITRFLTSDTLTTTLRDWASTESLFVYDLITCPWCIGFWVSLACTIWIHTLGPFLLIPWAVSYAVGVLEGYIFD